MNWARSLDRKLGQANATPVAARGGPLNTRSLPRIPGAKSLLTQPMITKVNHMNFRPLYDRVLVKRVQAEEKTASGLIVPDSAREKPLEATVIAVGSGRQNGDGTTTEMTLTVGDVILFGKYTGDEIKLNGEDHIILREEDVLAVVEN